jgi:phosphoesterase RecJ-like protein
MLTKVIEQAKIDHFTKWFERADKIVIVSHVSPDGDAIGSSLGLYHFFDSQEKTVNVIVPNAFFGGCRAAKTFSCTTVTKNLRIS